MYISNRNVGEFTTRLKLAFSTPQAVPAHGQQSSKSKDQKCDIFTARLRRTRRQARRHIGAKNMKSSWY